MKKIFLFLFILTTATVSYTQVRYGLKAGYNNTDLIYSGSAVNVLGNKSNFNVGIFVALPLFSHFYLQPELMYSGQGSNATDSIPTQVDFNYLNLPVLFKYQEGPGLFWETGVQVGFLLGSEVKTYGQSVNTKSYTQSMDFAWVFGLGYNIPKKNLGIDIRYNRGLTNALNGGNTDAAKNSAFQFDLFYQFKNI
jgi:hypothetical protein